MNECEDVTCTEGECINTEGSYHCECDKGYTLSPQDQHTCEGKASLRSSKMINYA